MTIKRRGRLPVMLVLEDVVRHARARGYSLSLIGDVLGLSEPSVCRIAKRVNAQPSAELRGRWRLGQKGSTPAQIVAHADPRNVVQLLERHGHLDAVVQHIRTEAKRRHWGMSA